MQAPDTEGIVRTFGTVLHAVTWAYETIERCPSYAQPKMFPSEKRGAGGFPPEDYQDLAYTIITALASMQDQQAAGILRAMGAEPQARGYWLTVMAGEIASMVEWPVDLARYRQCGMAMVAILRVQDELENKRARKPEIREYAKAAGVSAPSITQRERWRQVRMRLEEAARALRDHGIHELAAQLEAIGILRSTS